MGKGKFELKNTIGMFDFYKGIVMFLIILVHTQGIAQTLEEYGSPEAIIQHTNIFVLIFLVLFALFGEASMPALFIVSGYGFRKTTTKKCIAKQVKTLLVPYIISAILTVGIHFFAFWKMFGSGRESLRKTIHIFAGALFGMSMDRSYFGFELSACGPIWFLLSLGIGLIVFNILVNHFEGAKLMVASLIVAVIGWGMSAIYTFPWSISQGFMATFYIAIGYWLKKNKVFTPAKCTISKRTKIIYVIVAVVLKVLTLGFGFFNLANEMYPLGPVSVIANGLLGVVCIRLMLEFNRFDGVISSFVRKIGRQSLYVMCIHSIEIVAVGGYLQYMFVEDWQGSRAIRSLIILSIRSVVVFGCTFIFAWLKESGKLSFKKD